MRNPRPTYIPSRFSRVPSQRLHNAYTEFGARPKFKWRMFAARLILGTHIKFSVSGGGFLTVPCRMLLISMGAFGRFDADLKQNLDSSYADFCSWKKINKISCSHKRFSVKSVAWPVVGIGLVMLSGRHLCHDTSLQLNFINLFIRLAPSCPPKLIYLGCSLILIPHKSTNPHWGHPRMQYSRLGVVQHIASNILWGRVCKVVLP